MKGGEWRGMRKACEARARGSGEAAATSATIPLGWRVSRKRRDEATTLVFVFVAFERSRSRACAQIRSNREAPSSAAGRDGAFRGARRRPRERVDGGSRGRHRAARAASAAVPLGEQQAHHAVSTARRVAQGRGAHPVGDRDRGRGRVGEDAAGAAAFDRGAVAARDGRP